MTNALRSDAQTHNDTQTKFSSEEELFHYINRLENEKLLEDHPDFGNTAWSFSIFSAQRVATLYNHSLKTQITPALEAAFQNQAGLVQICTGDYENPVEVVLTPDVTNRGTVNQLKSKWVRDYCQAHNVTAEVAPTSTRPEYSQSFSGMA